MDKGPPELVAGIDGDEGGIIREDQTRIARMHHNDPVWPFLLWKPRDSDLLWYTAGNEYFCNPHACNRSRLLPCSGWRDRRFDV